MKSTKAERVESFLNLMSEVLPRQIADNLCNQLCKMGFFDAPASTKYHGNYEGGLFDHSYRVTRALLSLTDRLGLHWEVKRSPYVVGMLHDVCKCDQYVCNEDGTYSYQNNLLLPGHGDKSAILALQMMPLTEEELLCIRWHMGAYDDKEKWNSLGKAIEKYPNVLYTHTADMIASKIVGI